MKHYFLLLLFFLCLSCVAIAPPRHVPEAGKSLIVGRLIFDGSDIDYLTVNLNGKAFENIEVVISHNHRDFKVKTVKEGLFYFLGDSSEIYRITGFNIKRSQGARTWSSLSKSLNEYNSVLAAGRGITYAGSYRWNVMGRSGNTFCYDEFVDVQSIFERNFPQSPWCNELWTNGYQRNR